MRGHRLYQSLLYAETAIPAMEAPARKGRSEELLKQRNEKIIHRIVWYKMFHTDLNYDAVIGKLEAEFDLAAFTLGKMVAQFAYEIKELSQQQPTRDYFRKKFPYLVW